MTDISVISREQVWNSAVYTGYKSGLFPEQPDMPGTFRAYSPVYLGTISGIMMYVATYTCSMQRWINKTIRLIIEKYKEYFYSDVRFWVIQWAYKKLNTD